MSLRMQKVDRQIQRELMSIVQKEIDDPVLEFLSITRVKTTRDLRESRVYFSMLNDTQYKEASLALQKMKGFIRSRLGKRIRLKVLPDLEFFPDETMKYSVDIYQRIEEIKALDADQKSE